MAKIKYIGKSPRMVVDRYMFTDDEREIHQAIAMELVGDNNFVITWGEGEEPRPVEIVDTITPAPLPALPKIGEEHPNLGEEKQPKKRGKRK